jgi:hypothetical protein
METFSSRFEEFCQGENRRMRLGMVDRRGTLGGLGADRFGFGMDEPEDKRSDRRGILWTIIRLYT